MFEFFYSLNIAYYACIMYMHTRVRACVRVCVHARACKIRTQNN